MFASAKIYKEPAEVVSCFMGTFLDNKVLMDDDEDDDHEEEEEEEADLLQKLKFLDFS